MQKETQEDWREEFDKRFCSFNLSVDERCKDCEHKMFDGSTIADNCKSADEYIKDFISNLLDKKLEEQRKEIVERVKQLRRYDYIHDWCIEREGGQYVEYDDLLNNLK